MFEEGTTFHVWIHIFQKAYHMMHTTWCIPHDVHHMMNNTWCIPHDVYHMMHTTWYIPHDAYHMHTTWCIPHDVYHMMHTTWCIPHDVYHMHTTWCILYDICHMMHTTCYNIIWLTTIHGIIDFILRNYFWLSLKSLLVCVSWRCIHTESEKELCFCANMKTNKLQV